MTEDKTNSSFSGSIDKLRGEFDTLIEKAVSQGGKALNAFGMKDSFFGWVPTVDVSEDDESIFVDMDVPGYEANDLDVKLAGNMLTIEGEREGVELADGVTSHVNERKQCSFKRVLPMPTSVNPDDVKADISKGVLHLTIAKAEACIPKQIEIHSGNESSKSEEKKEEVFQETGE